jgi:catechol 2,3-dioxygenase-like lactoylglutathione lyase family enzyme
MELHFIPNTILPHPASQQHFCLIVDDLEAYRQRLIEAGYTIIEADPIPTRPRFFCRDPLSNLVEFSALLGDYRDTL